MGNIYKTRPEGVMLHEFGELKRKNMFPEDGREWPKFVGNIYVKT